MDSQVPQTPRQIPPELEYLQYCKDPRKYGLYLKGLREKKHENVYDYTSWVGNLLLQNFQCSDLQQGDGSTSSGITTRSMSAAALKAVELGKVMTRAMAERARGPVTSKVIPVTSKPPLPPKKTRNKKAESFEREKAPSSSALQLDPPPEHITQSLADVINPIIEVNPNPESETGKNNEAEVQEFGFRDEQGMIQHEVSATPSSFESSVPSEREGAGDDPELFGVGDPELFGPGDPEPEFYMDDPEPDPAPHSESDPAPHSESDQMHKEIILRSAQFEEEIEELYNFFTRWCDNFKTTVHNLRLEIKKLYERKISAIRKYSLKEGPKYRANAIVRMMETNSKNFSALILYLDNSFLSRNADLQTKCKESEKLIENPSLIRKKFKNQNDAFCRFGDAMSLEVEIKVSDFMVTGKEDILLNADLMRDRIRALIDKIRRSYADLERQIGGRDLPELVKLAKSDSEKYQNETEGLYKMIFRERCAEPSQEKEVIFLQTCKSSMDSCCNHFFSEIYRARCFQIFKDSRGLSILHKDITRLEEEAIAKFQGVTKSSQLTQQFILDIKLHKDSVVNLSSEMFLATKK